MTIIIPTVIYGSETWNLLKESVLRLCVFDGMLKKRITGSVREGEMWRIRSIKSCFLSFQSRQL